MDHLVSCWKRCSELECFFSWIGAVIASVIVSFPLLYQSAKAAFDKVEVKWQDVARTMGASEWRVFWTITIPLAWPGILAGTILAFARGLGEFGATLMIAGYIPGKTDTIPLVIYFAVEAGQMEKAAFWVLIIVSLGLTTITWLNIWGQKNVIRLSKGWRVRGLLHVQIMKKLHHYTLDVCINFQNEITVLLGPSGSGKTTILDCIAGLKSPDEGSISFGGFPHFTTRKSKLSPRQRNVGYVFQDYALFPHMTVDRNIRYAITKDDYEEQC